MSSRRWTARASAALRTTLERRTREPRTPGSRRSPSAGSSSSVVRYAFQPRSPVACSRPHSTQVRRSVSAVVVNPDALAGDQSPVDSPGELEVAANGAGAVASHGWRDPEPPGVPRTPEDAPVPAAEPATMRVADPVALPVAWAGPRVAEADAERVAEIRPVPAPPDRAGVDRADARLVPGLRWRRWRRGRRRLNHERRGLRELANRTEPGEEARLVEPGDVHVIDAGVELEVVDPVRLRLLEEVEGFDVLAEEVAVGARGRTGRDLCDLRLDSRWKRSRRGRMAVDVTDGGKDGRCRNGRRDEDECCAADDKRSCQTPPHTTQAIPQSTRRLETTREAWTDVRARPWPISGPNVRNRPRGAMRRHLAGTPATRGRKAASRVIRRPGSFRPVCPAEAEVARSNRAGRTVRIGHLVRTDAGRETSRRCRAARGTSCSSSSRPWS
jgi:hypothetical protein